MDDPERRARQYLASLGEPLLPEGLLQRVRVARRRRLRGRAGAAVGSLAATALAVALVLPLGDGGLAPAGAELAEAAPGQWEQSGDEAIRTLQAIDRALQAAYDRNASDAEIEPLWEARRELVQATPVARGRG